MKLGPDVEPPENELLKAPPEANEVAATGGPATPETGVGAARRLGLKGFLQILGPGVGYTKSVEFDVAVAKGH
jgi:hypothetical protein